MSTVRDFPSVLLGCAQLPNERNTLGGIVSGVPTGTSVVLANGREDLPLTADGGFTFTTPLAAGSAYAVTVKNQSQGTGCVVRNGTGAIGAASVDTVAVRCAVLGSLAVGLWEQDQCVPGPDCTGLKNGWSLSQASPKWVWANSCDTRHRRIAAARQRLDQPHPCVRTLPHRRTAASATRVGCLFYLLNREGFDHASDDYHTAPIAQPFSRSRQQQQHRRSGRVPAAR